MYSHVFASQQLHATEATYLHEYDELSDHTPLEVVFSPQDGLQEGVNAIDRSTFTPSENRTVEASSPSLSNDGLNYADDVRTVDPAANYRRGRFKMGWNSAVDGTEMDEEVLGKLTWENLGWRFGTLFGDTSEDLKERMYEWCVEQQLDTPR